MKYSLFAMAAMLAAGSVSANTSVSEKNYDFLPKCSKPASTIVVSSVSCKAAACQPKGQTHGQVAALLALAGQGVPDMSNMGGGVSNALVTALKATGCFDIQEREAMEELRKEMELAGLKLEAKPADFMVLGSISTLEAAKTKSSFGGGIIPVVGSLSRSKSSISMTLDLRIVEVKKAAMVDSRTFTANSENLSWGIQGAGLLGGAGLFGSHRENKGDPSLDRVAADTVVQSVHYLVNTLAAANVTYRPAPKAVQPDAGRSSERKTESAGSDILGF